MLSREDGFKGPPRHNHPPAKTNDRDGKKISSRKVIGRRAIDAQPQGNILNIERFSRQGGV
jgi:hypothetical protein